METFEELEAFKGRLAAFIDTQGLAKQFHTWSEDNPNLCGDCLRTESVIGGYLCEHDGEGCHALTGFDGTSGVQTTCECPNV